MNDTDATTPATVPQDDTTGHVLHGEAAEHPTTGGRAPSARAAQLTGEDDAEGHRFILMADGEAQEDDTEGHRFIAQATDQPDDDTEGHRFIAQATDEPGGHEHQ